MKKGVNYVVKSAVRKLNPLGAAHHLRTQSHAINFCQIIIYLFIEFESEPLWVKLNYCRGVSQ